MTVVHSDVPSRSRWWRARRRIRAQLIFDTAALLPVFIASAILLLAVARGFAWYAVLLPLAAWPVGAVCAAWTLALGERIARLGMMPAFGVALAGWALAAVLVSVTAAPLVATPTVALVGALVCGRIGALPILPGVMHQAALDGVNPDPTPWCAIDADGPRDTSATDPWPTGTRSP